MAIFRGEIRSRTMEMDTGLAVILPYDSFQELPPAKTLYLLHGLKQSAGAWLNMSSIGRYAKEHNLAVVMPEVQRSFTPIWRWALPISPMCRKNSQSSAKSSSA